MSLRYRLERAFEAVIKGIPNFPLATVNVYRGAELDAHQAPCVVCWCKGGVENPAGSGNRAMQVTIIIKHPGIEDRKGDGSDLDPIGASESLSGLVLAGLQIGDPNLDHDPKGLAAKLTAAGRPDGLTVYHPVIETAFDPDLAEVSFLDSVSFQVFCCGANILA